MTRLKIRRFGKGARLRSKNQMQHKPSGRGKGKWHNRASLWAYKRKSRRKRLISNESRRRNRAA
jgi:hypothetical protein